MNNAIQCFDFKENPVRIIERENQPWFVAADVCRVLEIANHHHAINGRPGRKNEIGLDDDERGVASVTTPSGEQKMLVISESGLYALIFKSRKPQAKAFRKWVTSEVLPAIRKTGAYRLESAPAAPEEIEDDPLLQIAEPVTIPEFIAYHIAEPMPLRTMIVFGALARRLARSFGVPFAQKGSPSFGLLRAYPRALCSYVWSRLNETPQLDA